MMMSRARIVVIAITGMLLSFLNWCGGDDKKDIENEDNNNTQLTELEILEPVEGDFIKGEVIFKIKVTGTVYSVEIKSNDDVFSRCDGGTDTTIECSLDTTQFEDGNYEFIAIGYKDEEQKESIESNKVNLIIDNTPPEVEVLNEPLQFLSGMDKLYFTFEENMEIDSYILYWKEQEILSTDSVKTMEYNNETIYYIEWNTEEVPDDLGMAKIVIKDKAGNTGESQKLLIVLNNGDYIQFTENRFLSLSIPENWQEVEIDQKVHWEMPSQVRKVIVWTRWDAEEWSDNPWNLRLDVGIGWCPHSGDTRVSVESNDGLLVVDYENENGTLEETQWFAHIKPLNPEAHVGDAVSLEFDGVLLFSE